MGSTVTQIKWENVQIRRGGHPSEATIVAGDGIDDGEPDVTITIVTWNDSALDLAKIVANALQTVDD